MKRIQSAVMRLKSLLVLCLCETDAVWMENAMKQHFVALHDQDDVTPIKQQPEDYMHGGWPAAPGLPLGNPSSSPSKDGCGVLWKGGGGGVGAALSRAAGFSLVTGDNVWNAKPAHFRAQVRRICPGIAKASVHRSLGSAVTKRWPADEDACHLVLWFCSLCALPATALIWMFASEQRWCVHLYSQELCGWSSLFSVEHLRMKVARGGWDQLIPSVTAGMGSSWPHNPELEKLNREDGEREY